MPPGQRGILGHRQWAGVWVGRSFGASRGFGWRIHCDVEVTESRHADLGLEPMSILIASFLIWVINLLLPTLLALIILKQKKAND